MSSPKASIIIPSFNAAAWLAHAIESLRKQTYANIEIIVIDDCSTDSTHRLMDWLLEREKRIVYLRNKEPMGCSYSRNLGNSMATGDYIFVQDADDLSYPNRVRTSIDKLKSGKCDFIYGASDVIDAVGNIIGKNEADSFDWDRARRTLLNHIVHTTMAYTKEIAQSVKYRGLKNGEDTNDNWISRLGIDDWAFQIDCYVSGARFDYTPSLLAAYRYITTGISFNRDPIRLRNTKLKLFEELGISREVAA